MLPTHVRFSSQIYCDFVFERSLALVDPEWRGLRIEGSTCGGGDNAINLLMTRVVRSWSMGPGLTCVINCYCLIYCSPFVMWCREPMCTYVISKSICTSIHLQSRASLLMAYVVVSIVPIAYMLVLFVHFLGFSTSVQTLSAMFYDF